MDRHGAADVLSGQTGGIHRLYWTETGHLSSLVEDRGHLSSLVDRQGASVVFSGQTRGTCHL